MVEVPPPRPLLDIFIGSSLLCPAQTSGERVMPSCSCQGRGSLHLSEGLPTTSWTVTSNQSSSSLLVSPNSQSHQSISRHPQNACCTFVRAESNRGPQWYLAIPSLKSHLMENTPSPFSKFSFMILPCWRDKARWLPQSTKPTRGTQERDRPAMGWPWTEACEDSGMGSGWRQLLSPQPSAQWSSSPKANLPHQGFSTSPRRPFSWCQERWDREREQADGKGTQGRDTSKFQAWGTRKCFLAILSPAPLPHTHTHT